MRVWFTDGDFRTYDMRNPGPEHIAAVESAALALYRKLVKEGREAGNPLTDKRTIKREIGTCLGGPTAVRGLFWFGPKGSEPPDNAVEMG